MSIALMTLAFKTELPTVQKFVLVALCDNANDQGECYPSISSLMARCSLTDRAVQKSLVELEAGGFIKREFRTGRATNYQITDPRTWFTPAPDAPPNDVHPRTTFTPNNVHPTPERGSPPPPNNVHPTPERGSPRTINEPSIEPSKNQKHGAARSTVSAEQLASEHGVDKQVAADWLTVRKAKKSPLTQTALDNLITEFAAAGMSTADGVRLCVERGWVGFKPDWLKNGVSHDAATNHRRRLTPAEVCQLENEQHAARRAGHVYNA